MTAARLLPEQIRLGKPEWLVGSGAGQTAHMVLSHARTRTEDEDLVTLCGYSITDPVHDVTARHCARCTASLRSFVDSAVQEIETVIETVTITVARPADSTKSVQDIVATAMHRSSSTHDWPQSFSRDVKPYPEPVEGQDARSRDLVDADHVHTPEGRCIKDRIGLCPVAAAQRAAERAS